MAQFTKEIKACYPGDSTSPLLGVNYYQADELFIIINEKNELLEVSQCNIPALIAMLQSVSNDIR